ncbi:hypothetical protein [Bradyrhizobium oligotrophicum]|uniref:hypothetical protein n=1 Tax=Bradyrhizobium TaxID=374 RepID=UPI003EB992BF
MIDKEDDPQIVEVFARFGRAMYMANVVELSMIQTLLQVEFLTPAREKIIKDNGKSFDPKAFATELDAFMRKQAKKTMGTLNMGVSKHPIFDEELRKRIMDATLRRNFLAHHYWPSIAEKFMTKIGRDEMIAELSKDADTLEQLDIDVRIATKPVREKLGINEEALNQRVEQNLGELRAKLKLN